MTIDPAATQAHEEAWARIVAGYAPDPVVYFVGAPNGLVKIGFASDLEARFDQLVSQSAVPLRILGYCHGSRKLEGEYHARFKQWRRHGEWFELSAPIEAEIERLWALPNRPNP